MTQYLVYQVTGPHTPLSYYGYAEADTLDDCKDKFIHQSLREDNKRGDVNLVNHNNNETESLEFILRDIFSDEVEAHLCRNELRSTEADSISGPTNFPIIINRKAQEQFPDRIEAAKNMFKLLSLPTARTAYGAGLWSSEQIKSLLSKFKRDTIVQDLDTLTPRLFSIQYNQYMN